MVKLFPAPSDWITFETMLSIDDRTYCIVDFSPRETYSCFNAAASNILLGIIFSLKLYIIKQAKTMQNN